MSLSPCESDKAETLTNTNICDSSMAYREATATGNPDGDCPESFTEDQSAATGLVLTKLKGNGGQTDSQGKLSQETKPTSIPGIENEKGTIPETSDLQIENGCQDKLTDSNREIPDVKSRINQTERENITAQFEDRVPEKGVPGQAVVEGALPRLKSVGDTGIGVNTEQNSFKNKDTVGLSGSPLDQRIISKNTEEQLRHKNDMPVTETCHSFDANKTESIKTENVVAVDKQDPSLNLTISYESQFTVDNAKTMAKVPETLIPSSQSMITKVSSDNVKLSLTLASAPNILEKDYQEFTNSKTTKDQSQSLDSSKINVFTPTSQSSTNVNHNNPYTNSANKNFKLYGSLNGVNLKTTPQSFGVHTSQSFTTHTMQTKSSMPLLSQISADNSTRFQRSHFGEGQMTGQQLYQPNRPLQSNIQRPSDVSTPLQRASSSYLDNCTLLQNKYVNEINPTNQINLYNANQNKTDTDQGPLNLTDTRPKLVSNNYKNPNVVRLEIQNMSQQHNQPTTHSVRPSNLYGNDKEILESDTRFSFPTTPGMNNGFSHNQRSYFTSYDAQTMQYAVHSDNSNIRRNSLWDRTPTVGNGGNNNQRAGVFSVQQLQQNSNQFGSQYLLMWPNTSDQMIGTDKLRIPQRFTNQRIVPSYQQACKNIFPNPIKDNNVYSNPNDAKLYKNDFSDGRMGLSFQQNQGKIANTANNHDRIPQQVMLQSIPRTYNINGKTVPPHQSEIFRDRENNNYYNSFPVSQTSLQWGQSSEYVNHPNFAGNDLKVRLSNESQSSSQSLVQSQASNSHLQTPSYDHHHYTEFRHFPLTNANRFPVSDVMPPSPKIQNSTRSNFQIAQYPIGLQSRLTNPESSTFQSQKMTTVTSAIPATTLEAQKKTNTLTRDGSRLTSGQNSEPLRYLNNTPEFGTARPGQAMTTYPTRPTMANDTKLGTRLPSSDTNTIRPNYTSSSASSRGQSPNNPDSILTWSQYYPHNPDPTRSLHQSHSRGYMNYDSQHRGQNLTQFNTQQNNIDSAFYVSQSYNNYTQQIPSTAGDFQGSPKPSNSISTDRNVETTYNYRQEIPSTAGDFQKTQSPLNSISKDGNVVTTYNNSNMGDQTFENVRKENQITGEKFPVEQEISNNMTADKVTLKAETHQRKAEFPAQAETPNPNPAGSEQFQRYNCVSGLYPKCPEISADINRSEHTLPSSSASGSSTKSDDFLGKALTNPNLGMTSEESFLFSDFDPLFTSSLLTNDLDYFPENNAAYDQCFADAASVTMAMVAHNEERTLDPNLVHASQQQQQQQQLTPLLNINGSNNGGGSATDIPSSRNQYNQIPSSQTTMGGNQINNEYNAGADNGKPLAPLVNKSNESMYGYVPGVDLLTLSSKTSRSNVARTGDVYPNDSVPNRFSDLYNVNSASHLAIPISYDKSGNKWISTKGTNVERCDAGVVIKRRNRQKKERLLNVNLLEATKNIKKKPVVSKVAPRPRGRPPKNRIVAIANVHPTQSVGQELIVPNPAASSNTSKNLLKPRTNFSGQVPINPPVISIEPELGMENTSPSFPVCGNLSAESDKITFQESGSLVSQGPVGNSSVSIKGQRKLSDREVIDAVTKCLESISRNEEQPNSDQIKEGQPDTNSENTVSSLDGSVLAGTDSPTGSDAVSLDDQALSREKTLMRAYIELKKKLEERMSRSLWRQSYLKRHKPKSPQYSRKLSKKECMTAYSGTTSLGPEDDLFSRYPNRSTGSNDGGQLVVTADCTSVKIDINSNEQEVSNQENLETIDTEPIKNPVTAQEQIPVSNNQHISSTELSEPKSSGTPRLPSMIEVVRTRLSNEAPPLNTSNPEPLTSEEPSESPVPSGNIPRERSESVEEPNDKENSLNEPDRIKDPECEDASNLQPRQPRLLPRYLSLRPYSPSPLLLPPPPPPIPPKVVHCLSKRETKVGPNIVENAKNCFEAIGKYLTTADSDFDSFLISYANIVQGLLNSGADRYSRIKVILLNGANLESGDVITGEGNKTSAANRDDSHAQESSLSNCDIDASDIQGDADRRNDQIDVDDFSSSYADIVKVILSSRADEYRNIKQALSRHICGFTDLCQWPTNDAGKKVSDRDADVDVPVPSPTGCDEVNNVAPSKAKQKPPKKGNGNISENSATKKRRKRKIQESAKDIGMQSKLVFHEEILQTKTPRRRVKKLSKNGSTLKDRKRSSFDDDDNRHSSGFRIILSSNSFIEQSVTRSDSSFNIGEEGENVESRQPVLSDDGFVEESTGDYIMNMDSESGGETKFPGISETGSLNGTEQQKPGALRNANILENVQTNIAEAKTATRSPSSECSINKVLNCEGSISDPKVAVDEASEMDKVTTTKTENNEEGKRQRPSRKSAGVGAIKCPCGCCDEESSLKRDSVENNSRFLSMSFKKRNRTKIIKPKSANPSKGRGRPRVLDTRPQEIISKLLKDINDTSSIRSGGEEPSCIKISEDLLNSVSVTNQSSQIRSTRDDKSNFRIRRELDSDSNEPSDDYVCVDSSSDSDKWKPKKPGKNENQKTPKENQRDLKYNSLHNNRTVSSVGDGTARNVAEDDKPKMAESASDENETWTENTSLNPNEDVQSLESSEDATETSFQEFSREESVSKARISFKDFVPNLNSSTPLSEIPKEEHPGSKDPESLNSIENNKEASGIFTGNYPNSDITVESNESFESFDREGDPLGSTLESGGQNLTCDDVVRNIESEVNVNSPSSSNDASFQPKDVEIGGSTDVPKEEPLEDIETKIRNETSEKPKETSSCEERLRSLIETITEINTTIKQVDVNRSDSVESNPVKNLGESFMKNDLEPLGGGHLGSQNSEEMRVKTEIVERIDETIVCQIGINGTDDSSCSSDSDSDSTSGSSSSEGEEPGKSISESHSLISPMELKMSSPLNSRKRKLSQTLKVTSVDFANKIIIRKTWQEKGNKFHKLKRKTKNIFDIMSSNDTEDEEDFKRGGLIQRNQNKKAYGAKKALSISLGVNKSEKAQSSKSKVSRAKKDIVTTKQDQNMDSDSDKPCLSLQKNGSDKSLMLSETPKSPRENFKIFKASKKRQNRTTKDVLTDAKTLPESEGLNGSDSAQKDISKNSQTDTKVTISDSFKKRVVDSKIKPKKFSKKSKTALGEPSSNDQNLCISFESPKGKKLRTSLEPPNNSHISAEKGMEGKEMLIVSGIIRRSKDEIIGNKSYSDLKFSTPLKQERSLSLESSEDRAKLKPSEIDLPDLQCTYCPKYFKKPYELLYHTRSHTGDRPFSCDQCDKSFLSNSNLQRHRRTHSSERKHVCPTCGRGFTQHYGMLVHQLIHSGLKPHKCPDCSSAFRTKGSLSSHRRKRHPEVVDTEKESHRMKVAPESK